VSAERGVRVDVHQHFWSGPLVAALEARDELPFGRRDGAGRLVVHARGEVAAPIDLAGEHPAARAALLAQDGVEAALVALSSPIGIEALPRGQAQALIAAHLDGVQALGARFAVWGPVALDGLAAADVDGVLARGAIGVSLPAGALRDASALRALGAVLVHLEECGAPLFVHPGPGLADPSPPAPAGEAIWWSALTAYVRDMQAAWLAFVAFGRPAHPRLRVVFAMLAGLAPLLHERLAVRGGPPVDLADPLVSYETSSFGGRAVGAMAAVCGRSQLLYGSDRPVIAPAGGHHGRELAAHGAWLIERAQPRVEKMSS